MIRQLKKLGAAVSAFAAMISCNPVYADTKQGNAEVTVVRPLSFVIDDDLDFGNVIRGTTAGTVTIAPNGNRTSTGGVILANGGGFKAASFAGQGTFNQRVDVSLGANSIFITGPGVRMRLRNFVIGSTPTAPLSTAPRRFTIAAPTGIFSFPVGATLEVGANQASGKYTGTWSIILNYF